MVPTAAIPAFIIGGGPASAVTDLIISPPQAWVVILSVLAISALALWFLNHGPKKLTPTTRKTVAPRHYRAAA